MDKEHEALVKAAKDVLRLLEHTPGAPAKHWMVKRLRAAVKASEAAQ